MTLAQDIQSINVMIFGPDNILFVGDSYSSKVFALELENVTASSESQAFNLSDLDRRIASHLGVSVDQVTVNDLAVHPRSREAYLGVMRGHGQHAIPILLAVSQKGDIRDIDWANIQYSSVTLDNPPEEELLFWKTVPARSLSITDIEYSNGEVFVAGLSNADFASTLYRIPYPFTNDVKASSIEIYHAVHNQNETRAPIRTFSIVNLEGKAHLLAAYTCTPLVTIPIEDLQHGSHVCGKTIGELGYGNTPIDMLSFRAPGADGLEDYVLISNKARDGMVINLKEIAASNAKEGLSTPVQLPQQVTAGINFTAAPLAGVLHIDNQDEQFFLAVRRHLETGRLELVSIRKGFYFRLSDFINEYDFPDYRYPENDPFQQGYVRKAHELLKTDEGHAELIK
jgi:hypothetical protein